ncbi:FKBP-type peptidyl-prolyl isomerase domain protein [Parasphaerochaeta coccoides DSM 17374]|uniref:Peptidyl-prolyl cis-trans isomerase n=2 Tax=Parasphaerochaeta TaxID=3062336 RepID=F4GI36_PARC1|nr:FKBP-type peptidyl-prolyl isomerase domain protein [Parasphaerochaeta coccoides DSM 17374]
MATALTSFPTVSISVNATTASGETALIELPPLVLDPIRNLLRPETFVDRFSYAYGYLLMDTAMRQQMDINPMYLAKGLLDAAETGSGYFSAAEIQTLFAEYNDILLARAQMENEKLARANLAEANAFLEENKNKENILTTPSGLQYRVLKEGSGQHPVLQDTVKLIYNISLLDGTLVDASGDTAMTTSLSDVSLSTGLREGLMLMNTGSRYRFWVHPDIGYGAYGFSTTIGPNKLTVIDVTMEGIEGQDVFLAGQPPTVKE